MKYRSLLGLALVLLAAVVSSPAQNSAHEEIISASTMIAFGRPALTGELADPLYAGKTLTELLQAHREDLKNDTALQRLVDNQAEVDARGWRVEMKGGDMRERGVLYVERLKQNLETLGNNPDWYRDSINRAYQLVIRRDAYPEEIEYWKPYGTLPYVVLVGAIENWALRNQPGLMVTTGTPSIAINSRFLRTQRVSLAVANEARTQLGLPVWTDVARQHSPGRNIVAVGAKDIESVGGVHFLLAGGGPLAGI